MRLILELGMYLSLYNIANAIFEYGCMNLAIPVLGFPIMFALLIMTFYFAIKTCDEWRLLND